MARQLGASRGTPQGLLRVNATLGFGRSHVAPVLSRFARQHPQVDVQLQLSVNPPPASDDSYDVNIRFGCCRLWLRCHRAHFTTWWLLLCVVLLGSLEQ